MKTGTRTMKTAGVALALALAAGAAWAQDSGKGETKVAAWARANAGWDFEGEKQLGKPDGDWDATGAGATLTWTKGKWAVEGAAEITSENFGATYGGSGSVKATYEDGDWKAYGKFAQELDKGGQVTWKDTNPAFDSNGDGTLDNDKDTYVYKSANSRIVELSVENWKPDTNPWGVKAVARFFAFNGDFVPFLEYAAESDDNKAAFFINFLDKQVLLEAGYGDYSGDKKAWQTPGPLEKQYERADDEDSALRLQFKPAFLEGLNVGFAYLPGILKSAVNGGFADSKYLSVDDSDNRPYKTSSLSGFWALKPADAIRATTFGVKYAPADLPVVVAAGLNLAEDAEKGYGGFSYKLLDKKLTLALDGELRNGRFPNSVPITDKWTIVDLGQKIVFVDDPDEDARRLELGLSLKENRLVRLVDGKTTIKYGDNDVSAADPELVVSPYVQYQFVPKIAIAKLGLDLTKGLGAKETKFKDNGDIDTWATNGKHSAWTLSATLGWSVADKPKLDPDDIGTGFVVKYVVGQEWDKYDADKVTPGSGTTKTNKLYFGFKVSY
jgi:hypothetical protein